MLTQELKDKINRVIEKTPEENLEEVLDYLNSLASKPKDNIRTPPHITPIFPGVSLFLLLWQKKFTSAASKPSSFTSVARKYICF